MTERIDIKEFFAMLYVYIIANDLSRGFYARELENNVWIPSVIGLVCSIIIFSAYLLIYKNNHYANFADSIKNILGKYLSKFIFIIYALYFIMLAYLNTYDFFEMAKIYMVKQMPIFVLAFVCLYVNFYVNRQGIEVIGRVLLIISMALSFFYVLSISLLLIINVVNIDNILPIMENGIKPIIKPAFRMSYAIPYGELFCLFIVFQYVKNRKKKKKIGLLGIAVSGLALILITFLKIFLLGPKIMASEISPAIGLSHLIDYGNLIQRFDIIAVTLLSLHAFGKVTLLTYVAKHLISCTFPGDKSNASSRVRDAVINGIVCFVVAVALVIIRTNYLYFLTVKYDIIIPYISVVFELIIPFILILLSFIRKPKDLMNKPDFSI